MPNNNPTGANGVRLGSTPQEFQSLAPQRRFATQRTVTSKSRKSSPSTAPRVSAYHTQRAAELRQLAAGAPWALQDIAAELHARSLLMERGHHEGAAAAISQKRHLELS